MSARQTRILILVLLLLLEGAALLIAKQVISPAPPAGTVTIVNAMQTRLVSVEALPRGGGWILKHIGLETGERGEIRLPPGVYIRLDAVGDDGIVHDGVSNILIEPKGQYAWYTGEMPQGKSDTLQYYHPAVPWPSGAEETRLARAYIIEGETPSVVRDRLLARLKNIGLAARVEMAPVARGGSFAYVEYFWEGEPPNTLIWPIGGEMVAEIESRRYGEIPSTFQSKLLESGWSGSGNVLRGGWAEVEIRDGIITVFYRY